MKQSIFTVISNEALTQNVYKMVLGGDTSAITAPGQFVNITLSGRFLRRPISVNDCTDGVLTITISDLYYYNNYSGTWNSLALDWVFDEGFFNIYVNNQIWIICFKKFTKRNLFVI